MRISPRRRKLARQFIAEVTEMPSYCLRVLPLLLCVALSSAPIASLAQPAKTQAPSSPPGAVSAAQPWVTLQEWFCLPRAGLAYDANRFAVEMSNKINAIGNTGWEPVAFSQVSLGVDSCFVATFKRKK